MKLLLLPSLQILASLASLFIFTFSLVAGATENVSSSDYLERDFVRNLGPNEKVCEPSAGATGGETCYFSTPFEQTISRQSPDSPLQHLHSQSERAGTIVEVKLRQLVTTAMPETYSDSLIFDFYIRLYWEGVSDGLEVPLHDAHAIKGLVARNERGELEIQNLVIPDLFFFPSFDLAEVFGRNAALEKETLDAEIMNWVTDLVTPALEGYFNSSTKETENPQLRRLD